MSYPARAEGLVNMITKTIQIRRITHTGHCWRSKEELICDILLWTLSQGRAKIGRPTRTYIQQLCTDTDFSLEDLPGSMDERDGWRERVRKIRTSSMTWWFVCTQFNVFEYCYASLTIQLNDSHLFTNNSMIKQFVYTQLSVKTVLFQVHKLKVKHYYLTHS